jgi:uncharacterized protein (DUF608 family)
MADMLGDQEGKARIQKAFDKGWASLESLWRDDTNKEGEKLQYYITCFDPATGKRNNDVWTNQLDAHWYLLSIGEEPLIPEDRVKKILKTVFRNNRAFMGWAMCKTENGKTVKSDQGKDVYTTSNYVFAQLLDYYGMSKESKEVYKHMDRVVFDCANSMITPDNLGAVWTHLVMNYVKEKQAKSKSKTVESKDLMPFFPGLLKGPGNGK